MQLKVSEWDDLPGTVLAERSLLRCCCRRKRRPEVQELKLADLLGALGPKLMESIVEYWCYTYGMDGLLGCWDDYC